MILSWWERVFLMFILAYILWGVLARFPDGEVNLSESLWQMYHVC